MATFHKTIRKNLSSVIYQTYRCNLRNHKCSSVSLSWWQFCFWALDQELFVYCRNEECSLGVSSERRRPPRTKKAKSRYRHYEWSFILCNHTFYFNSVNYGPAMFALWKLRGRLSVSKLNSRKNNNKIIIMLENT